MSSDDSEAETADSGASFPESELEPGTPREVISDIELTIGEHSKFIADTFDTLFAEVELLKKGLADMETELRSEMDSKIKALQEMLLQRIQMLEARADVNEASIVERQSCTKQQTGQYDALHTRVGVLFFRFH